MLSLLQRISAGDLLLCDGAMGTMLIERGLKPGDCPEAWNLEHPETLTEIARLYVEAGPDIVETNTFGANPLRLAEYGLEGRTEEIVRSAVLAARRGVEGKALIALACGPTGCQLMATGDNSSRLIRAAYERQIRAAETGGIDAIFIETQTDLAEAVLAIEAAKAVAPGIPIAATMTFGLTPGGFRTLHGDSVAQAAAGLAAAGADMVGSNCGDGADNMVRIAGEFRDCSSLPLVIQPSAGLPRITQGRAVYPGTPETMSSCTEELISRGVTILGGCCGTTPEHIAAFRHEIDRFVRH